MIITVSIDCNYREMSKQLWNGDSLIGYRLKQLLSTRLDRNATKLHLILIFFSFYTVKNVVVDGKRNVCSFLTECQMNDYAIEIDVGK